jgi:hypothetical protein
MKTIFLSCLVSLFSIIGCSAQDHSFDRLFDRYADKEGFLTVKLTNLPAGMLSDEDKDPELRISSLRILTVQDDNLNKSLNFFTEIVPRINKSGYEELMTVRKKGEKAILLCKKSKKRITEVLFISGGDKNVIVEITGSLSLAQAKKITGDVASGDNENPAEEAEK